jgi:hypothetical protein
MNSYLRLKMVAEVLPFHIMHTLVTICHFCYRKAHLSILQDLRNMVCLFMYNLIHDYQIFLKRLNHPISQSLLQVFFNSSNPQKILPLIKHFNLLLLYYFYLSKIYLRFLNLDALYLNYEWHSIPIHFRS